MPTCTRDSLVSGAACYKNFDSQARTSIQIYLNALELAAAGGTSYTIGSGGTLEAASVCLRDGLDIPFCPPNIYELVIHYNNAVAAGATPVTDNTDLANAIKCNLNFPLADKAAQLLQLLCELGYHTGD